MAKYITRKGTQKYEIRFRYEHPLTGEECHLRRRISGSLEHAKDRRDELLDKADRGRLTPNMEASGVKADSPFREFADDYLADRKGEISPSEWEYDQSVMERRILPAIGDWKPKRLELWALERVFDEWSELEKPSGGAYSPTTIHKFAMKTRQFIRWVYRRIQYQDGLILLEQLDLPEPDRSPKGRALTKGEAQQLGEWFREESPQWWPLYYTLLLTGQRFGEITALEWGDIRWDNEVIVIERSQRKGRVTKGTKTGKVKTLPMPDRLETVLREWKARMERRDHPGYQSGLVFPARTTPENSSQKCYLDTSSFREAMTEGCREVGIDRATPHDLRRTFNTWVAESGSVSDTVLRSITGHSSQSMSDHYYYGTSDAKRDALETVDQALAQ